jgi:hypothetical protein
MQLLQLIKFQTFMAFSPLPNSDGQRSNGYRETARRRNGDNNRLPGGPSRWTARGPTGPLVGATRTGQTTETHRLSGCHFDLAI